MKEPLIVIGEPLVGVRVMVKSVVIVFAPNPVPEAVIVKPLQLSVAVTVPIVFAKAGMTVSRVNNAMANIVKRGLIDSLLLIALNDVNRTGGRRSHSIEGETMHHQRVDVKNN
jgi:hypothetical protein